MHARRQLRHRGRLLRHRGRIVAAAVVVSFAGAIAAASVAGAHTAPAPPPFPSGHHAFPVMGPNGQLLRDASGHLVYYTPPSPAALTYLMPGTPPVVKGAPVSAGPVIAHATRPSAAQIAALDAQIAAAEKAAAAAAHR